SVPAGQRVPRRGRRGYGQSDELAGGPLRAVEVEHGANPTTQGGARCGEGAQNRRSHGGWRELARLEQLQQIEIAEGARTQQLLRARTRTWHANDRDTG